MPHRSLPLHALGICLLLSCAPARSDQAPRFDAFRSYAAVDTRLQSTLVQSHESQSETLQRLFGVTQLDDGSWLAEDATLDGVGRLVRAEAKVGGPCGREPKRIVLDARAGTVDVSAPSLQTRWSVPTDLPWVWAPLLDAGAGHGRVATPLSALVALRAAGADRALRSLDLDHFRSDTIMIDQVVVSSDTTTLVVLGDDVAEFESELPERIHLAALGRDLEALDPQRSAALAAGPCGAREESKTL